ncbi:MAG: hypothetical protein WCW14_03880 [Candidatus Paceibacterota bacterium]
MMGRQGKLTWFREKIFIRRRQSSKKHPKIVHLAHEPQEEGKMHQREALSVNLLPGAELTVPWARQIVDIAAV